MKRFISFRLDGQLPGGKNQVGITHTGHHYAKPRFRDWREDAEQQLQAWAIANDKPFQGTCRVDLTYAKGDRRIRDVPGMMDALCHLLGHYGVVTDDGQLEEWHWVPIEDDYCGVRATITERDSIQPSRIRRPRTLRRKPRSDSPKAARPPKNSSRSHSRPKA